MCALGSSQRRMASGLAHGKAHAAFRRAVWVRACVPGRLREHARGFPACCGRTGFLVWRGRKVYTFHRLCAHAAPCAPAACAAALCGAKCKKRRPVDISAGRLLRMQKGKGALLRAAGPSLPRRAPFGPRALAGLYKLYNGNDAQRQPKRHGVLGHADMREAEGV